MRAATDTYEGGGRRERSPQHTKGAPTPGELTAQHKAAKSARNIDYGSAFVMADLTPTPAHAARLRMIDILEQAHLATPGGLFAEGKAPSRGESHVSVIEVPVGDLPPEKRGEEKVDRKALAALRRTFATTAAPRLALDEDRLEVFSGPRGPNKQFEVVSLCLRDPNDALGGLRARFQGHGGAALEKSAAMHLTLAFLKLGTKLDDGLVKQLLQVARDANRAGGTPGWVQQNYYYSARYSDRAYARFNLRSVDDASAGAALTPAAGAPGDVAATDGQALRR